MANKIDRAGRAMVVVNSGLAIADGLLFLGQAVPLIGETCKVARTILGNVQKLAKKVDDVVTMGERVVDTLQLLDKMKENFAKISADNAVLSRWENLNTVLVDINVVIEGFGKKGWMKRAFALHKHHMALSKLDKRLGSDLDLLIRFYNIKRDARVFRDLEELKKPRNYPTPQRIFSIFCMGINGYVPWSAKFDEVRMHDG